MIKHAQTIRRQTADELFEFDHFVKLALKGLSNTQKRRLNYRPYVYMCLLV